VKDLGVIIDSELKFDKHINHIVSRAQQVANLIHKCFVSKDTNTLVQAYTTYVRPLLEYASSVLSPHSVVLVKKIESDQRRFTKRISRCDKLNCCSRLAKLGIDSLELRRLRFGLISTYKILFGLMDTSPDSFISQCTSRAKRGHSLKIFAPQSSSIDAHKYFFSRRVIQCWNDLPACDETFTSFASFKQLLNKVDLIYVLHTV